MSVLILDIDGTIANIDHRAGLVEQDEPDWDAFFDPELVSKDKPIPEAQKAFSSIDQFDELVFLTGRPESLSETTQDWLQEHFDLSPNEYELFMRPDDDDRPSVEVKEEIILELVEEIDKSDILFVDDEEDNLVMMSQYGEALEPEEAWELFTLEEE